MSALLITGLRLFYKEYVLTPRGKDMNPELGPVVAASPEKKAITSLLLHQRDFLRIWRDPLRLR